jgi:hypothetical protein
VNDKPVTAGRIVNFVLGNKEIRPAIVVKPWSDQCVQLHVFLDGMNDLQHDGTGKCALHAMHADGKSHYDVCGPTGWATSVQYADGAHPIPGTWHWPSRA